MDAVRILFVCTVILVPALGQLGTVSNLRLKGVTIEQPPFVFYDSDAATPTSQFYGFAIDLYKEAFQLLGSNNSFDLYLVPDGNFGVDLGNGTWNGMVGELLNGNADIIVGPLTETSDRFEVIDFTAIYTEVGFRIVVKIPGRSSDPFSFFDPFETGLWVLILFTAFIMAFVMWIIDRLSPYGYRNTQSPEEDNQFDMHHSIHNALLTVIGQGGDAGRSWSTKTLVFGFFFFALIITSTYTANLAAFLTTQSLSGVVSNVDEINKKQIEWAAVNNSYVEDYFSSTTDPKYKAIEPLMVPYETYEECLEALRSDDVGAIIHVDVISDYYVTQHPCDTMTAGNVFLKSAYAIPLPKNSNLTVLLSEAVIILREQGVVDSLYRKWYDDTAVCDEPDEKASSSTITVSEVSGLFYLLIIFIGFSFLILGVEMFTWRFKYHNNIMKNVNRFCGMPPDETTAIELQSTSK